MSTFHIHARIFEGSLAEPIRNELQSTESNDHDDIMNLAAELVARGFHVWVYRHDHGPGVNGARAPFRVIAEWSADGTRRR